VMRMPMAVMAVVVVGMLAVAVPMSVPMVAVTMTMVSVPPMSMAAASGRSGCRSQGQDDGGKCGSTGDDDGAVHGFLPGLGRLFLSGAGFPLSTEDPRGV
jgi:hypothetical protein